jgi:CheY-like chemotaxis protein
MLPHSHSLRAIVADDDKNTRRLFSRELQRAGFVVTQAEDGRMAFNMVQAKRPHVLVIDYQMPYLTGLEVLMGCADSGVLIPVVVMVTADYLRTSGQFREVKPHVDLILSKPVSPSHLSNVVTRLATSQTVG